MSVLTVVDELKDIEQQLLQLEYADAENHRIRRELWARRDELTYEMERS